MNNYYFTESKWYGPIENGIDFNNDDEAKEYYLSLPSGDSLIPEFAGMVKEEGKDFVFSMAKTFPAGKYMKDKGFEFGCAECCNGDCDCEIVERCKYRGNRKGCIYCNGQCFYRTEADVPKTAVPVAEEIKTQLCEGEDDIAFDFHKANAEEGKQTFSEEDVEILFNKWENSLPDVLINHLYDFAINHTYPVRGGLRQSFKQIFTEYLKTKQ